MRLLVIEDSMTVRKLVEIAFRQDTDVQIEFALSGLQGIEKAKASRPDTILLDYVLPDMKGIDVCRDLWSHPRTATTPVILITAKGAEVTAQFAGGGGPVEYLPKPFTPAQLTTMVRSVFEKQPAPPAAKDSPRPPATARPLSEKDRQALNRALYSTLRPRLSRIPAWMNEISGESPAPFFAGRILTSEVLDELVTALQPVLEERLDGRNAKADSPDCLLSGQLRLLPPFSLFSMLAESRISGELRITHPGGTALIWFRDGRILAASNGPPGSETEGLLKPHTIQILLGLGGATSGSFVLRAEVPPAIEARGHPMSFAQLQLEALRERKGVIPSMEPEALFERAAGFSKKVVELDLDTQERKVLSLLDGKTPLLKIGERAALPAMEVRAILHRLACAGLARKLPLPLRGPRRLFVIDPADPVFCRDLAAVLASHPWPFEVIELTQGREALGTLLATEASLVLVNASATGEQAEEIARALVTAAGPFSPPLVALLDIPDERRERRLLSAGYGLISQKPLHVSDIEHFASQRLQESPS